MDAGYYFKQMRCGKQKIGFLKSVCLWKGGNVQMGREKIIILDGWVYIFINNNMMFGKGCLHMVRRIILILQYIL